MSSSSPTTKSTTTKILTGVSVVALVAFVRVLVGFQPHSGQDDHHGSIAAYGGDYEAQRHWMELTYHLPVGDWYYYDVEYWGLDYPPLTAYVSWLCGFLSHHLIGPPSVAFETSRGYEDPTHKAFLRATVLATDLLVYGTAAWTIVVANRRSSSIESSDSRRIFAYLFVMLQPAILLIDHGHFQYNTTALGLALWSFYFMSRPGTTNIAIGSFFFCCALSFKQMTLYYAPAVFCYLLGRCFRRESDSDNNTTWMRRFATLGVTVVATFAVLWGPFVAHGPADMETTPLQRLGQVLRRVLPFQRGLFEGKVSNLWCALSVHPVRIRLRIPAAYQPLAALGLTLALIAPACYRLFRVGRRNNSSKAKSDTTAAAAAAADETALLWGTTNCALAFFLASFHVHEKSLLLALAPATLLWTSSSLSSPMSSSFPTWFAIVTAWTLWPLLVVDRLQVAYVCLMLMFVAFLQIGRIVLDGEAATPTKPKRGSSCCLFDQNIMFRALPMLSYVVMIGLHIMEQLVTVPTHLPDLFPVLWSVVGCGLCCLAWIVSCWGLYVCCREEPSLSDNKDKTD